MNKRESHGKERWNEKGEERKMKKKKGGGGEEKGERWEGEGE